MTERPAPSGLSRRTLFAATSGLAAAAAAVMPAQAARETSASDTVPFWGKHQGGIVTPTQRHSYFAAFDLQAKKRGDVAELLRRWTTLGARLSAGLPAEDASYQKDGTGADSGDVVGIPPSRLTVTFGFGPGLFVKGGVDRYGLLAKRPEALVDMPVFPGDQLIAEKSGGDLSVQACADDPQVAFHAIRQFSRLAYETATIRWMQRGFSAAPGLKGTPRNLMGFKDGSNNPLASDAAAMDAVVWTGDEAPAWMRGGSYVVIRRARIALEHWDRMKVGFQEQTIGRQKVSGAPLGGKREFDRPDLAAMDKDGNPVIAENSHVRLASADTNDGARIFRRAYSYDDGVAFTAERWPPWKQGVLFDAGLLFICYQRDPRTGFIKLFEKMAKFDMMNQFVTNTSSALFACPGGVKEGNYIGQSLFEATSGAA